MASAAAEPEPSLATIEPLDPALVAEFAARLTYHADFPKPGITFVDFFPAFRDADLVKRIVAALAKSVAGAAADGAPVTHIAGLDSRGFMLGPMIAAEMGVPFVPIRKKGKLPGKCLSTDYSLEYGSAGIEVQVDAVPSGAVFAVVDDLLATGGTMAAAVALLREAGAKVSAAHLAIELRGLAGAAKIPCPCRTLVSLSDEDLAAAIA